MAQHNDLGSEGEKKAVAYLKSKGYTILKTNFRYIKNEVDIIAQFQNQLIAVEVKTRSSRDYGDPQDFVKPQQIKSIVTAVNAYIEQRDIDLEVRFDIVALIAANNTFEIEHIEDAFLAL